MAQLPRSPLIVVLAKVQFAPILSIQEHIPAIQEQVRRQGFPLFEEEVGQTIQFTIGSGAPAPASPKPTVSSRWIFRSADQREAFILTPDFALLTTNRYDVFSVFCRTFETICKMLESIVQPEIALQLGLRYVDLIMPVDNLSSRDCFHAAFRGISGSAFGGPEAVTHLSLTQVPTPEGVLNIKVGHHTDGTILPPDLQFGHGLRFAQSAPQAGVETSLLDIDHITQLQEAIPFKATVLLATLDKLHDYTRKAFLEVVTEEALSIWGKEEESQ